MATLDGLDLGYVQEEGEMGESSMLVMGSVNDGSTPSDSSQTILLQILKPTRGIRVSGIKTFASLALAKSFKSSLMGKLGATVTYTGECSDVTGMATKIEANVNVGSIKVSYYFTVTEGINQL